jgi:hypothetical protein
VIWSTDHIDNFRAFAQEGLSHITLQGYKLLVKNCKKSYGYWVSTKQKGNKINEKHV